MRKSKRTISILTKALVILLMFFMTITIGFINTPTFAASSSVSISDGSPAVGDSFTVTVYYSGDSFGSVDGALTYDPSVLTFTDCTAQWGGGNGEVSFSNYQTTGDDSMAITFYFTVVGSGNSSVTAYSSDIYNYDRNSLGGDTASASFSVSAGSSPTENNTEGNTDTEADSENNDNNNDDEDKPASNNANLQVFSIACGEIQPAFSPDVTSYSVRAKAGETNADITAIPVEEDAWVEFGGSPELTQDEVTRTVTVTAPDGVTQKSYSIKITRDTPQGAITVDGTTYVPSQTQNLADVPAGFLASKINYAGKDINVLKSRDNKVYMVRLVPEGSDDSSGSWFVYNPETQRFTPADIVNYNNSKYVIVNSGVDLVYGGPENASGYQIYDPNTGELISTTGEGVDITVPDDSDNSEADNANTETDTDTTPAPENEKKSHGFLWFLLFLIIALALALAFLKFRGVIGKKKNTIDFGDDDEEDEEGTVGNKFFGGLAGLKDSVSSKFSRNSDDIEIESAEETEMSARRIERRRRIAEAEAREAEARAAEEALAKERALAEAAEVNVTSDAEIDSTPISEGSVVTKAELEAAKIAAAERARQEAERAAEEARAAQEAMAAAIAARDAARAAKAKIASSELDDAMADLIESAEKLDETVNKKED